MKFSLITLTKTDPDGTIAGSWLQNHIGTLETAAARARRIEEVNSHAITVAIVDELISVVPMGYWTGLRRLG